MIKKKWIILISILVLIVAGVIWFNTGSEPPIIVEGNLSAKDIADIKRIVHNEVRRELFPDFSLKSAKEFPANFKFYTQFKINKIDFFGNYDKPFGDYVRVYYQYGKHAVHKDEHFLVVNGTNGWFIVFFVRLTGTTTTVTSPPHSHH